MSGSVEIGGAGTSLLRASLSRTGKWAGGLGVVGGFVADILSPLAPFAAYIALAAAVTAVILAAAIAFRLVLAATALPALVFASTTAALAGGLFALQQASDAKDGVLAGLVPAITGLQQSMGIVAARVEKIEQTVTETAKRVETVKQTTQEVQQTAEKVEQKTEEIAANQAKQQEQTAKLQAATEQIAVSIDTIADAFKALAGPVLDVMDRLRLRKQYGLRLFHPHALLSLRHQGGPLQLQRRGARQDHRHAALRR
jgi:methyl-accepting chemotaxis protein